MIRRNKILKKKMFLLATLLLLIISMGTISAEYTDQREDNLGIADYDITSANDHIEIADSDMASVDDDLGITDSDMASDNDNLKNSDPDDEPKSFSDLDNDIDESPDEGIDITSDYKFNNATDENLVNGISLNINPEGTYTINGNNHVIDANNQSGVFKFNYGTVIINNLKICNAKISSIILYECELHTNNVTFENNYDSISGGAIYAEQSNYYSNQDKFLNNYADAGASIYSLRSIIDINNSTFTSDKIHWSLIYGYNSVMTVNNTVFENMTSKYATAIYSEENKLTVSNSKFINLFANATAGAIGSKRSSLITIKDCAFVNVSSMKNAGAVYADLNGDEINLNNTVSISDSLFENCSSNFGGAYLQLGGKLNMMKTNFINNTAEYSGGAIFLSNTSALIGSSKFDENTAAQLYGGAVYIDDSNSIINNVEFSNNFAGTFGDAIYLRDSEYDIKNSRFFSEDISEYVVSFFDRKGSTFNKNNQLNGGKTLLNQALYNTIIDYEGQRIVLIENPTQSASPSDERFDLRDYTITINGSEVSLSGIVKDQGSNGACWAFGATGALESAFLKSAGILLDLSENNIQGVATRYSEYGTDLIKEGGFATSGMGLFLSWLGVISAEYDNYDELGKISIAAYAPMASYHIQDTVIIPKRSSSTDNDKLKDALVKYGGLTVHIYGASANNEYYNPDTYAQYYNGQDAGNHFVTLVGWDDNFSRDNFKIKPEGDGAWICKNSWGTDWGENGYFYVSYYDTTFARYTDSVGYIINNTENYTTLYQYDIGDIGQYFKDNGEIISFVNSFEAIDTELIKAVGTYFENPNEDYTIKVYVNNLLLYTQTGKSTHGGFETIKLNKQILVREGNKFSVEIQAKAMPLLEDTRIHFENGKSMAYYTDGAVDDLGKIGKAACIKVYAVKSNISEDKSQYYTKNNISIKSDAEGKTISIADKNGAIIGSAKIEEGKALFNLTLETGTYSIITHYDYGDVIEWFGIYDTIIIDESVKIGYNTKLSLESIFYDEEGIELFGRTISGSLDGKNFTGTIENIEGMLSLTFSGLSIGTHTLILQNPQTYQESTTIIKVVSRFSGNSNVNMYYGDASSFKVRVYGNDGNPVGANQIVTIKLNKVTYKVKTNSNGYAILKIPNTVKPGTYTLTATYAGQTIKNTIKVTRVLKLTKVTVKKSAKSLSITATLKKGKTPIKSKKLTFKFNGKTYTAKTNSKGIAKITIKASVLKKLKVGKTVKYQVTYLKDTVQQSVKVKK